VECGSSRREASEGGVTWVRDMGFEFGSTESAPRRFATQFLVQISEVFNCVHTAESISADELFFERERLIIK
jgi:hypothetical protein